MMEVFVLVPTKKPVWMKLLACFALAATAGCLVLTCSSMGFLPFCALFAGAWYYLQFASGLEYEYSYFDGEVRFARITNKSRRKRLKVYSMDEVIKIAPAGDSSVLQYENDNNVTVKDYTSGKKENPYYDLVVKDSERLILYKVELDEQYLDAVCMKYASRVVRKRSV